MFGLNFHNFQRLSYFFPFKWTKKGIKEKLSKPSSFFYQHKSLPNSRATHSLKSALPTVVHQIKQKSTTTKYNFKQ